MDIVRVTASIDLDDLIAGYRAGLFPMGYEGGRVITWHRPRLRGVLPLERFHASRSLSHTLKMHRYEVTLDQDFAGVMDHCAARPGVWITAEIKRAYLELFRHGFAHSLEIRVDGALAGGLYGIHLGGAFFAESKFHTVRDMSKVALAELVALLRREGFGLLDVQYWTPHLDQFGVTEIPDGEYRRRLAAALGLECRWPGRESS